MTATFPEPADVETVRAFARSEVLRLIRRSSNSPTHPCTPIAISVVRNERARLPDFLDHHRRIGVGGFVFIDNGSDDGGREYLAQQPDVTLFIVDTAFDWRRKHGWITQAINRFGRDRWWLLLDADEHAIFAGCEQRPLRSLVKTLESSRVFRARGALVDMYAKGPVTAPDADTCSRLANKFPYFDVATYQEHYASGLIARTGGPRQRLLAALDPSFRPALTKYPLFRLRVEDVAYNPHAIWPPVETKKDPCLIGLKHYKFDSNLYKKSQMAVSSASYWNRSYEYKKYIEAIDKDPNFSLHFHGSRRFSRSEDFLVAGIISGIDNSETKDAHLNRIAMSRNRRLADLIASTRG